MTGDDKVRALTATAADRAVRENEPGVRRRRVLAWVAGGVLVLCLVGGFWYFSARLGSLQGEVDGARGDARQLADQVEQLGGTPVVEPPAPGERGDTGAAGADGRDGRDGADGEDGRDGPPGVDGRDGIDGPAGDDGPSGPEGAVGQAGTNPPCLSEPAQCRGADGRDGADGADGAQGPPGPTCPPGFAAESRPYDPNPLLPGDEETWWVCVAEGGS